MRKTGNGLSLAVLGAVVVLLLYVLSIGPAVSLTSYQRVSRNVFLQTYSPLLRTARLTSFTNRGMTWYLELWPRSPLDEGCALW